MKFPLLRFGFKSLTVDLSRFHGRFNNLWISTAPAEISDEGMMQFFKGRFWVLIEQGLDGHDLTRGTEPALQSIVIDEGPLNRMELTLFFEPLYCLNRSAFALNGEDHAGIDRFTVKNNGTGPAGALVTSLLCSSELQIFSEGIEKGATGLNIDLPFPTIDDQSDWNFSVFHSVPQSPILINPFRNGKWGANPIFQQKGQYF
jgi:hypothetical protein